MSVRVVSDNVVMELLPVAPGARAVPRRSILDAETRAGVRILALAEPATPRRLHGDEVVSDVIAAVERSLSASNESDPSVLLARAFTDANDAVTARNLKFAGSDAHRRIFVGLVIAAISGERLVIAISAPGQAIVVQDGQAFAMPVLGSARAMSPDSWSSAPLGMFTRANPTILETAVSAADMLVLGGRGLSAFVTSGGIDHVLDGPPEALEERLDEALSAAAIVGDVLFGRIGDRTQAVQDAPAPVRREEVPALTLVSFSAPILIAPRRVVLDDELPSLRFDQWHTRVIEASERWLARKDPLPVMAGVEDRAVAAIGGGAVRRYQPRHRFSPGLRSIMPRWSQVPWLAISIALAVTVVLGGLGIGYNLRQTRASRQESYLTVVEQQFDRAASASSPDAALPFLDAADAALNAAEENGVALAITAHWAGKLSDLRDSIQEIHRFASVVPAGALPGEVSRSTQLVEMGGALFVIAGSVFQVDADGSHLATLLAPGAKVGGRTAGKIQNGAADGDELVVSDGRTLFRWTASGKWSAEAMPSASGSGWLSAIHGAYLGNYYLLDASKAQILKFTQGAIGSPPVDWLDPSQSEKLSGAVDMELDGAIHVLLANGSIETLYMGKEQSNVVVSYEPGFATEIGLAPGVDLTHLYVLERGTTATRLILYNATTGQRTQFQVAGPGQTGYSEGAAHAFANATDFAVNEADGTVSFIADGALWIAALGT